MTRPTPVAVWAAGLAFVAATTLIAVACEGDE